VDCKNKIDLKFEAIDWIS